MSEPTAPAEPSQAPTYVRREDAPKVDARTDGEVPPGHSTYTGAPYDDNPTPLPDYEEPPPEEAPPPVISALTPSSAALGSADVSMSVTGTDFVDGAVIVFNNGDEPTTFVSGTEVSTLVRPSTAVVEGPVPVKVRNPDSGESGELSFTFDPAAGA